jgi:hypothetical protein
VRSSRWAWLALLVSPVSCPLAISAIIVGARAGRSGNGLGALASAGQNRTGFPTGGRLRFFSQGSQSSLHALIRPTTPGVALSGPGVRGARAMHSWNVNLAARCPAPFGSMGGLPADECLAGANAAARADASVDGAGGDGKCVFSVTTTALPPI